MRHTVLLLVIAYSLLGCAGTIQTIGYPQETPRDFRRAYVVAAEHSQYIRFQFGTIMPFGYVPPLDGPAEAHEAIGNTASVIQKELEKYGLHAIIGKKGDTPEGFDVIVQYDDTWRWDFKKIIDHLEIRLIASNDGTVLAKSTYNIYKNKELHNFPTPEKIVPKMMGELLNQRLPNEKTD